MIPVINYIDKLKLSQIYDLFIAAWLHVNKRSGLTKRLLWVNLVNLSEKWRLNLNHYVSNFKEHILRFFCIKNDRYLICLHINTDIVISLFTHIIVPTIHSVLEKMASGMCFRERDSESKCNVLHWYFCNWDIVYKR